MLRIDVITIFPELFEPFLSLSTVGIARREGLLEVAVHDLRAWTKDRHRSVDDAPYGGGPGMVMKPEPLVAAVETVAGPKGAGRESHVVLLSPQGRRLDQGRVAELGRKRRLALVCGRYEGVDERFVAAEVDEELSLGDFVLSGGELPAMAVIEAVTRLLPGALGHEDSAVEDSFSGALLDCPHYTRPEELDGRRVPEVLLSGDHEAIRRWRLEQALARTLQRRPDLVRDAELDAEQRELLDGLRRRRRPGGSLEGSDES